MKQSQQEKLNDTAEHLGLNIAQVPRHIAIIMDGNGRWAQHQGLPRYHGHRQGAKTVEEIALYCVELGMESLTLYSFSMENWKRPRSEVNALMHLYARYLVEIRETLEKNNVTMVHLGRKDSLPEQVRRELEKTIELTRDNTGMILALALNYGGRTEIIDAVRKIAHEYKQDKIKLDDIDEQCLGSHLYTAGLKDPDLLIRTANEMRISNFLLWQISYSEFFVTRTLWPDFKKNDLEEAILAYSKRHRHFGTIETETDNLKNQQPETKTNHK